MRRRLDRLTLQPLFYAQCFATTPVVLLYSLAGTLARLGTDAAALLSGVLLVAATACYFSVEAAWFNRELKRGWAAGIACGIAVLVISLINPDCHGSAVPGD